MKDTPGFIDEDAESWISLMYGLEAAKKSPELRQMLVERLAPEVLKAADECTNYKDFKRRLKQYKKELEDGKKAE